MFKRMSVLVRRPGDDRATFSKGWEAHAAPVSGLPKVRGYIQNHVEAEFGAASPIQADGFVELLWDRPEDMAAAFASPQARPMVEDEPNFLGHGSGYTLAAAPPLKDSDGGKLIVAAVLDRPDPERLEMLAAQLQASPGLTTLIRDDVTTLIPKPGMAPPQSVTAFFHLYFTSPDQAAGAGARISALAGDLQVRLGVYAVRTIRFV